MSAAKYAAAAEVLDMDMECVNEKSLGVAFRAAAKTCHPDTGTYDAARWASIKNAKDTLEEYIKRRAAAHAVSGTSTGDCRACAGQGFVRRQLNRGFGLGVAMRCVMCDGSGNVLKKDRDQ